MKTCKANSCYDNTTIWSWENYCSYHEKCLSKLREYKNIDNIQELETFSTWFNGNCGYVINYSGSYNIWIVVYEPKQWNKDISENLSVIRYKDSYSDLSSARDKAQELKDKLQNDGWSDTPILEIYPYTDSYVSFNNVITSPYVVDNQVGTCTKNANIPLVYFSYSSSKPSDLDKHFKPLDIVWAQCVNRWFGNEFYHVGVFLGNDTVFHFSGDNNSVEKTTWEGFLKSTFFNGITGKILRYHPIIPFKNYKNIIRQAVWAKDKSFWAKNYNLNNRNCEHLANRCVYSINLSEHMEMKKPSRGQTQKQLDGSPNLSSEITQVNSELDNSVSYRPQNKINEIKNHKVNHLQGIDMECSIEVNPRYNYWYNPETTN